MYSAIYKHIDALLQQKDTVLVAIDGNCTAGKTTLARQLERLYDCSVFHMDEFFLQGHQRTPERYAEPGGNVDYERFLEEVLRPLIAGDSVCYRPYHCGSGSLKEPVTVNPRKLTVIEGTYSHHPYFEDPYDLKIFLGITDQLQRQRILRRPEHLHQQFFENWIPMEKLYFQTFRIPEGSHIVITQEATP